MCIRDRSAVTPPKETLLFVCFQIRCLGGSFACFSAQNHSASETTTVFPHWNALSAPANSDASSQGRALHVDTVQGCTHCSTLRNKCSIMFPLRTHGLSQGGLIAVQGPSYSCSLLSRLSCRSSKHHLSGHYRRVSIWMTDRRSSLAKTPFRVQHHRACPCRVLRVCAGT